MGENTQNGGSHNLSREQIAAHFGLSVATVDRLIRRKKIPYIKIGRLPRFSAVECEEYFQATGRIAARRAA